MYSVHKNNFNKNKKKESNHSLFLSKIFISVIMLLIILIVGITTFGNQSYELKEIEVNNGDSLWSIVEHYYGSEYNTRKLVYQIRTINDMENVILSPGEKILIPKNVQ